MKRYRFDTGTTSGDDLSDSSATSSPDELCCGDSLQQGRSYASLDDSSRLTYTIDYTDSTVVESSNESLRLSTMAKPAFDESPNTKLDHPLQCQQESPINEKTRSSFQTQLEIFSTSLQNLDSGTSTGTTSNVSNKTGTSTTSSGTTSNVSNKTGTSSTSTGTSNVSSKTGTRSATSTGTGRAVGSSTKQDTTTRSTGYTLTKKSSLKKQPPNPTENLRTARSTLAEKNKFPKKNTNPTDDLHTETSTLEKHQLLNKISNSIDNLRREITSPALRKSFVMQDHPGLPKSVDNTNSTLQLRKSSPGILGNISVPVVPTDNVIANKSATEVISDGNASDDVECLTKPQRLIDQPIPRKIRLQKNLLHNVTYSIPIYNVYPDGVSNPIFTNWKITTKRDKIKLPPVCNIQKGIIFKEKNFFVFSPISKDDIFNIVSAHMRKLKNGVTRAEQKKRIQFLHSWITLLSEDEKKYISLETIIHFVKTNIDITSESFNHPDYFEKFIQMIRTVVYMTAYDMPLLRTKPPQKKTLWLKQMSDIEYKFLIEILPHTKYVLSDKPFLDVIVDTSTEDSTFHLAEDILDIKPIKAIEYCCEEIYAKLQNKAKTLITKYNTNQCGHIFMMEMDEKCNEVTRFILNKSNTSDISSKSLNFVDLTGQDFEEKMQDIPSDGRTGQVIKFVKNTMINNPVWDLGLQLRTVSNASKKIPYKDVYEKILPNMMICPCSELFKNFDRYHEVEVKSRCEKAYFNNTKKFVGHLKRFRQVCPNHAAVLDIISYLYPLELNVAISKNANLSRNKLNKVVGSTSNKKSTTEKNSTEFKINR